MNTKDFIVARLTGKFVTDFSDTGGTNLFDQEAYDWSSPLLEAGLAAGTPVVISGGDGCCAVAGDSRENIHVLYTAWF